MHVARITSSIALLVWAGVLGTFLFADRLDNYLHPTFRPWAAATAFVLAGLAICLWLGSNEESCCEHDHDHAHGRPHGAGFWISFAILVVPVLVAAFGSRDHFSSVAVQNRGFIENVEALPGATRFQEPPLPGENPADVQTPDFLPRNEDGMIQLQVIDLLYAASELQMRQEIEGKEVEIVGQYMPAPGGSPSEVRFRLIRMFMLCCAADARPVSLRVDALPGTTFPEMSWLKVTGRVAFPVEGGRHVAVLHAGSIAETDPPDESMLY